ncbi:hypothetical protein NKI54_28905 [Mesorhizobium sp. M0663]|uniref:DUF7931 domain-containing protein n=1 Tax=unclassified Mesorhizobium TaxID=325217 RepID=UPI00333BB2A2
MNAYRARLRLAAALRDGKPIYNGSQDHASAIVEAMFEHANESVSILSGKLNPRVYGQSEVIEQASLFLAEPDHKLRVLVEDGSESSIQDHPFFEKFIAYKNVEVREVPAAYQDLYKFHFLVMDSDSYRFEADKSECVAVAVFGDKAGAKNIANIFESLWAPSTPIGASSQSEAIRSVA